MLAGDEIVDGPWISTNDVAGQLACWAVRQSPYPAPENLGLVIERFCELWPHDPEITALKMLQWQSYDALVERIWSVFGQIPELVAWNTPKSGHNQEIVFTSRYGGPNQDDDFIDLHALCDNVARCAWRDAVEER